MYNHVLVAVDGSDTANLALREAIKLAKDQPSVLRLVHVVETPAYMIVEAQNVVADYQKAIQEAGQKVLANCFEIVRAAGCEADTKIIVIQTLDQSVYDAIDEEAKRWPADLIVIGTHGRRGFRRLLLGSVAEGLSRLTSKPVLLIRGSQ